MLRRSHRKSKNGCVGCKRRHVKCDETRPNCVNCLTANTPCSYINAQTHGHGTSGKARTASPQSQASRSPMSSTADSTHTHTSNPLQLPPLPEKPYVNMFHLELFRHFVHDTGESFFGHESAVDVWPKVLNHAQSAPFLMYEILSVSALHFSIIKPESPARYLEESEKLQTESLKLYNETVKDITIENIIPAFLFSGLMGLHFFCNTFRHPGYDLNSFLDRFVQSVALMRGVRAVLDGHWVTILNSDISPLIHIGDGNEAVNREDAFVLQINKLYDTIHVSSNLTTSEISICDGAIKQLEWAYNAFFLPERADGSQHAAMVSSWATTVSAEYVDLLNQRKPEALVILVYFAVLAHMCRNFWAVGNSGRYLLSALEVYLGVGWDELMVWPRSVIYAPIN